MAVWCAGLDETAGSHVLIIRRINCINTTSGINSPDDGYMAARNM